MRATAYPFHTMGVKLHKGRNKWSKLMENKTQSSDGFGLLGIVVALAVVALVSCGGWYVWQARTHKSNPTNTTTAGTTSSNTSPTNNQISQQLPSVALLNGQLQTVLPSGWAKNDDNTLTQVIGGKTFSVGFAIGGYNAGTASTGSVDPIINIDLLDVNWQASTSDAVPFSILKTVTTAQGTTLYVVETPDHQASISTCKPTEFQACSIKINGKYVYSLLSHHEPTDQTPRELDFNDPATIKAVNAFIVIAQNLNL